MIKNIKKKKVIDENTDTLDLYPLVTVENISCPFSLRFCKFESNATSDWLNHLILNKEKSGKRQQELS